MGAISPSVRVLINLFCLCQATAQYAPVFANQVVLYCYTICLLYMRTYSVHLLTTCLFSTNTTLSLFRFAIRLN